MKSVAMFVGIFVIVLVCFLVFGGILNLITTAWNQFIPEGVTAAISGIVVLGLVVLISLTVFFGFTEKM